jgi:PEGA domain
MPMEFLVILFPRSRRVMVNGEFMGNTNVVLELEGGPYEVTLGPPKNFTPDKHDIYLRNTAALMPLIIEFKEAKS